MEPSKPANDSSAAPHGESPNLQVKLALAAIAVCALVALFWPRGESTRIAPGGFPLDVNGRPVALGNRMAPVTLIHFWATWCPPCISETPALRRLGTDLGDEPDFGLVMVAVDNSVEDVREFLGDDIDEMLFDPKWEVANRYGTDQLPETYLVVRGKVLEKFVGAADWDDPRVRQKIQQALSHVAGTDDTQASSAL